MLDGRVAAGERWFVRAQPRDGAALRLFCFAHAGGSASAYHPWGAGLPDADVWAVQMPGREGRMGDGLIDDLDTALDRLIPAITPHLDRPFALFGHSMGSLLAFEVARRLRRQGLPQPRHLFLSGRKPPTEPYGETPLHPLPDAALVTELNRRFGGIPPIILAEPELMAMFVPIIRADLRLLETAIYREEAALDIPFTILGGKDDTRATADQLAAWGALTDRGAQVRQMPGGHFYLHDDRARFFSELSPLLRTIATSASV